MNIYVRNLSPETSQSELLGCFEIYGDVTDVTISTWKVEGQYRASAFVEMPSNEQGVAAIAAINGRELNGNQLRLQED